MKIKLFKLEHKEYKFRVVKIILFFNFIFYDVQKMRNIF
jgi:hypothetical protein